MPDDVALYDHAPLGRTLGCLVNFGRLNAGETRLTVCCIDVESGEEVFLDNRYRELGPEHILASAAIMLLFPPVEIDGHLIYDASYTNSLPVDRVFVDEPVRELVCIALDLFDHSAPRPASLDAVLERANDLVFASAAHRTIVALRREYALRQELRPDDPVATLLHLIYRTGIDELVAKSFDCSPSSIRDRLEAGRLDMAAGLARLPILDPERRRFRYVASTD